MLTKLSIQNYALIDRLEIRFQPGFSVITGETGAGKSIILGALSLILGQRADVKSVKEGSSRCVIEGNFDISAYNLKTFFEDNDLEYDATQCILRREIQSSGKSRSFINDTPVSLNQLKELGTQLIDIHSQHQNLLLGDGRFQLRVIDLLAGNKEQLDTYRLEYTSYKHLKKELRDRLAEIKKAREDEDYLRFQLDQLTEATLSEGEQISLEQEQDMLSHLEEIKSTLFTIYQLLNGDEGGVLNWLKEASAKAHNLDRVYPDIRELAERLQSDYIDLKDIASEIDDRQENMTFDPQRMQWVNERLDLIYRLQQKHQVTSVEQLLELKQGIEQKLNQIDQSDELVLDLEKKIATSHAQLLTQAAQLTEKRSAAARKFARQLESKVSPLGMPNLRFEVQLLPHDEPDDMGCEQVRFLFSANKNQQLQPVFDVASGGEISRLMLGVKALIAQDIALPAIIFDEIDTGVSGEIADKMGDIMREMSRFMQVITISHLPQVASKGAHHYKVYKVDTEKETSTCIVKLSDEDRVNEIARMLSGAQLTKAALDNAQVLLNN